MFDGRYFTINDETGQQLLNWLEAGEAPPAKPALSESTVEDYLAAINGAADMLELRQQFTAAYKAADSNGDQEALAKFEAAKEVRKAALSTPEPQPEPETAGEAA